MKRTFTRLPFVVVADRQRTLSRIKKKRSDPKFTEQLTAIRGYIGSGSSLVEVRQKLDVKSDTHWGDLVFAMAESFYNPETILLEWQIRQQSRYNFAAKLLSIADSTPEINLKFNRMAEAVMIAAKIDDQALELQKALGLIKPIDDMLNDNGGQGISNEDFNSAAEQLERRLAAKFAVKRETQPADTVDVFPRLEPGGETYSMGPSTLDQDSTDGSIK